MGDAAVLTRLEQGVFTITLNRPDSLNSFDAELRPALIDAFARADDDEAVRAVVLTGTGRGFCAGANVKEFHQTFAADPGTTPAVFVERWMVEHYNPLIERIATMAAPVIAAVNGMCAGGGSSLAFACDVVLAARSAAFQQTFVPKLGIIPDLGATWTVPRQVGHARALAWGLTGDRIDAETAQRWGLVYAVHDDDALAAEAHALGRRLAALDRDAVAALKRALGGAGARSLSEQLAVEVAEQTRLCARPAFVEGVRAFTHKTRPSP